MFAPQIRFEPRELAKQIHENCPVRVLMSSDGVLTVRGQLPMARRTVCTVIRLAAAATPLMTGRPSHGARLEGTESDHADSALTPPRCLIADSWLHIPTAENRPSQAGCRFESWRL
jgi:hypothetical protein